MWRFLLVIGDQGGSKYIPYQFHHFGNILTLHLPFASSIPTQDDRNVKPGRKSKAESKSNYLGGGRLVVVGRISYAFRSNAAYLASPDFASHQVKEPHRLKSITDALS